MLSKKITFQSLMLSDSNMPFSIQMSYVVRLKLFLHLNLHPTPARNYQVQASPTGHGKGRGSGACSYGLLFVFPTSIDP